MKKCRICGREKKEDSFYKNKNYPDGLDTWCKICKSEYAKARNRNKEKLPVDKDRLIFTGMCKSDWCKMYQFLLSLGYDVKNDIHEQFSKRHGLPYKKRPRKNYITFSYEDCLDTPD